MSPEASVRLWTGNLCHHFSTALGGPIPIWFTIRRYTTATLACTDHETSSGELPDYKSTILDRSSISWFAFEQSSRLYTVHLNILGEYLETYI